MISIVVRLVVFQSSVVDRLTLYASTYAEYYQHYDDLLNLGQNSLYNVHYKR